MLNCGSMIFLLKPLLYLSIFLGIHISGVMASEWNRSHANYFSDKYSQDLQISTSNIKNLKVAWIYHSGDTPVDNDTVQTNPIIIDDTLIITTLNRRLIGLDPQSGKMKWSLKLPYFFYVGRRGLASYEKTIFVPVDVGVIAVNSSTGKIDKRIGKEGLFGSEVSLVPPIIHQNKSIIIINASGSIESFRLSDGRFEWKTSLQKNGISPRVWSGASYDPEDQIIYLNTSDANGLIGGYSGNGGYSCSVVAINAINGKILWSFQETLHDVWDLDLSGPPILTSVKQGKTTIPAIVSVSKTGNVLLLDRRNGIPIYGFTYIKTKGSTIPGELLSTIQKEFTRPTPFSSIEFNPEKELVGLSQNKLRYLQNKLQRAKFEKYSPISLTNSVVMFGLHGGAEWPGATVKEDSKTLYVPSNRYPWIIRTAYIDKNKALSIEILKKYDHIQEKCGSCHGDDFQGQQQSEIEGDVYIPSLIRYSSKNDILNLYNFKSIHNFDYELLSEIAELIYERTKSSSNTNYLYLKNLKSKFIDFFFKKIIQLNLWRNLNSINSIDLNNFDKAIHEIDNDIKIRGRLGIKAFWQLLLDKNKLPGTRPPWGLLSSIDLNTGNLNWQVPLGKAYDPDTKRVVNGDMNFGGVISTAGNLIFATGTRDEMARAFDASTGQELWMAKLPAAGSSPPMTYTYRGCQYVLFTATGGRYVGFKKLSDATIAYKLKECRAIPYINTNYKTEMLMWLKYDGKALH